MASPRRVMVKKALNDGRNRLKTLTQANLKGLQTSDYVDKLHKMEIRSQYSRHSSYSVAATSQSMANSALSRQSVNEKGLVKAIASVLKNKVAPQHINMLRYELQRHTKQSIVTKKVFRDCFRAINLRMTMAD